MSVQSPGERDLEAREDENIEGWGVKHSSHKRERDNDWVETYRTRFRRDRDRILYSKAFRRLQYKTQVLVNNAGDHHRTRLTHTLEVQQIATSLADSLWVNRDLTDAIAVGHDLGHTPFGHSIEDMLDKKLVDKGGFSHAIQSIRCIEHLEKHENNERGLNLDPRVIEGILKHDSDIIKINFEADKLQWKDTKNYNPHMPGSVEAQIVFWADTIAYLSHDWDDFVDSGLLEKARKIGMINDKELQDIWYPLIDEDTLKKMKKEDEENFVSFALRHLIRSACTNLVIYSLPRVSKFDSPEKVIEETKKEYNTNIELYGGNKKKAYKTSLLVNFDPEYREKLIEARDFINKYFIGNNVVARMDNKARYMVEKIYDRYTAKNGDKLLPLKTQKIIDDRNEDEPVERIIADHIACWTDRYANKIYKQLFMPWEG